MYCMEKTWQSKDTVEVGVLNPEEMGWSMAEDRGELRFLLPLHQDGHEVIDLPHVDGSHIIPTY